MLVGGGSLAALMARAPAALGKARPRADVTDPKALFAQINEAVTALREKVDAKADDVLVGEQIDRINATISDLQKAQDEAARNVAAATLAGGSRAVRDPEYSSAFEAHLRKGEVQASLSKGTGADGGFLAPTEWDRTIIDKLVEVSGMRALATIQTIGTNGFKKLVNLRGTASGWVGETAARTETATATFGEITPPMGEIYANPAATNQLLEDAEVNLETWLAGEIATEFAKQEGTAFISGSGTNRPGGFLNHATGGTLAASNPLGAIAVRNSGVANTIGDADDLVDLCYDLPSSFRSGAVWAMNRLTEAAVRKMKTSDGHFLWQPGLAVGAPATLLGYPIAEMPDMPNIAANSLSIAFGNFMQGYLIVERAATEILRDPFTNKPFVHFYAKRRVGGTVQNPEALKLLRCAV